MPTSSHIFLTYSLYCYLCKSITANYIFLPTFSSSTTYLNPPQLIPSLAIYLTLCFLTYSHCYFPKSSQYLTITSLAVFVAHLHYSRRYLPAPNTDANTWSKVRNIDGVDGRGQMTVSCTSSSPCPVGTCVPTSLVMIGGSAGYDPDMRAAQIVYSDVYRITFGLTFHPP